MSSKSSTTESDARLGARPDGGKDADTLTDNQDILVGLIHKPHGLRGEVAVEVLSDVEGRFAKGAELSLVVPGVPSRPVRIRSCRDHGRGILVAFEGVETRDGAEELRGGRLEVGRDRVPPAAEGEFYHFELVDCRCYDRGVDMGLVVSVIEDGGGVLLQVSDGEEELLVPFVKAFLTAVDTVGQRIDFDLPLGLVETCRSRS